MRFDEIKAMAKQLGIELPVNRPLAALTAGMRAQGLVIGLDQRTGDWVALDANRKVKARVS